MAIRVEKVHPRVTFALRQAVLRPHETLEQMALPGDDDPATAAFAALDEEGGVVGTVRVAPAPPPTVLSGVAPSGAPCWQLRGMATRADSRSSGIGGRVLGAALAHVAAEGGGLLWCNARDGATAFYRREGFVEIGEPFDEPQIGRHFVMWRMVDGAGPAA